MATQADNHDWQELFPYFTEQASPADQQLADSIRLMQVPAETVVFHQGDTCAQYLLVVEGSVKVLARNASGREIVLYRVQRGGSCVLTTSCLLGKSVYPAEGITETPVKVLAVPASSFHLGLARSERFREFVFESYGQRIAGIISLVEDISFGQLKRRLARYLLEHSHDNRLTITHHDLAAELGSAREVISRQLKDFEKRGWLNQRRGSITLSSPRALQALLDQPM